jgi:hypothetical protein
MYFFFFLSNPFDALVQFDPIGVAFGKGLVVTREYIFIDQGSISGQTLGARRIPSP